MFIINNTSGSGGIGTTPLINDLPKVAKRDLITKYLRGAINITTEDEQGNNVLHIIASMPKKEKITWLNLILKAGISKDQLKNAINAKNRNGLTPMQKALHAKINKKSHYHRTISNNDSTLKFIVALLNNGAKVDQLQLSEEYLAALSDSQKNYHINFLKKLASKYKTTQTHDHSSYTTKYDSGYESNADIVLMKSSRTTEGFNSLLKAAKKGDLESFKQYLKKTDITITDQKGNNILHVIASMPQKKKIEWLDLVLKAGIPNDQLIEAINAKNKDELAPMQIALSAKINKESHCHSTISDSDHTFKFIIKLLKDGADPSQLQLSEALSQSQRNYYHDFLKKLTQSSKDKIRQTIDHIIYGRYPLHLAVLRKDQNMFSQHLKNYSIASMNEEGNNILHVIASMPNKTKITWLNLIPQNKTFNDQLTEAINATNKDGRTPIQIAIVNKITKDTHRTFTISDNTVTFCIKLLKHLVLNDEAKSEDCRRHFVLPGKYSSDRYIKFLQKLTKDERIHADHTTYILGDILKEQVTQHQENKKLNKGIKNTKNNCWAKTKKCGKVIMDFINPNKTVDRMTKLAIAALTIVAAFFTFVIIAFAAINGQIPMVVAVPIMLAFVVIPIVIKYFSHNNELGSSDDSAQHRNEKPNSKMTGILTGVLKHSHSSCGLTNKV